MFMDSGLIHIYCGNGKGKTSAAAGLAVRAAGWGKRILFTRFLKNENSGELKVLDKIPEIEVLHLEKSYGFYSSLNAEEKKEAEEMYRKLWKETMQLISGGSYDVLVVDEFMAAYNYGLIPQEEALCFLKEKPEGLEVVLTGRNPDPRLVELADYVSEIRKIRHPFDRGVQARKAVRMPGLAYLKDQLSEKIRGSRVRIPRNTRCCIGGAMFHSAPRLNACG